MWGGWDVRGVLAVVGAWPGGRAAKGRAAAGRLRVAAAPLLPLAVFQQRHLRWQREDGFQKELLLKHGRKQ